MRTPHFTLLLCYWLTALPCRALSKIIKRDFFPDLGRLDAENEYLSALASHDEQWIEASVRRLDHEARTALTDGGRSRRFAPTPTPRFTPYARMADVTPRNTLGFTPARTPRPMAPSFVEDDDPRCDTTLSLDAFQSRYTSEDNASFAQLLHKANLKRRDVYSWAWEAEQKANARNDASSVKAIEDVKQGQRLMITAEKERLAIEAGDSEEAVVDVNEAAQPEKDQQSRPETEPHILELATELQVALPPTIGAQTISDALVLATVTDTRKTSNNAWPFKTRNAFMYPPDSDVSTLTGPSASHLPRTINGELPNSDLDVSLPKAINHGATSFGRDTKSDGASEAPSSPRSSRIEAAIKGIPYHASDPSATPKVNGFGFVSAVPSPRPEEAGPSEMRQLMTWGKVQGTPIVVRTDEEPAAEFYPFKIPEASRRERIGSRLSSAASRSIRLRQGGKTHSSSIMASPLGRQAASSSTPQALGAGWGSIGSLTQRTRRPDLSPAARTLLDRTSSISRLTTSAGATGATTPSSVSRKTRTSLGTKLLGESRGRETRDERWRRERWTPTPSPIVQRELPDPAPS